MSSKKLNLEILKIFRILSEIQNKEEKLLIVCLKKKLNHVGGFVNESEILFF